LVPVAAVAVEAAAVVKTVGEESGRGGGEDDRGRRWPQDGGGGRGRGGRCEVEAVTGEEAAGARWREAVASEEATI
jgi:hypothetical protein